MQWVPSDILTTSYKTTPRHTSESKIIITFIAETCYRVHVPIQCVVLYKRSAFVVYVGDCSHKAQNEQYYAYIL
jgi:hypothetical protein